jgi:hypothetical protein
MWNKPRAPHTPLLLNALCEREREVWRVHVHPAGLPEALEAAFDEHGEAFPVLLDFEELERQLARQGEACEKRATRLGSVELSARAGAANTVAAWLLGSLASGFRDSGG